MIREYQKMRKKINSQSKLRKERERWRNGI